MRRDRIFLLVGLAFMTFSVYYVMLRLMAGDAIRENPLAFVEPSALKEAMKEIGALDRGMADDMKILTADDCAMIELQSLALAKIANDMKVIVPPEVSKASRADWIKMLDATIASAIKLSQAAELGEKAEGPVVARAYREMAETCVICHKAFGIEVSAER